MGRGLNTQLGTGEEVTYGTPVTVTKFYEINSESLDYQKTVLQSSGLRAGARQLRRRGSVVTRSAGGNITLEVVTVGMGRWFKHCLGGTPTSVQQGGTTAYLQTFSLGNLPTGLTVQKGVEEATGTVKPFTFHGGKVTSWELACAVGDIVTLSLDMDFEDVDTSTALATASYPTISQFDFTQGTLSVEGSEVANVTGATIGGTNNLKTDSFYLGTSGLKGEPVDNDFPSIQGSLSAEFVSQAALVDRFLNDTAASLVLTFTGAVISGAYNYSLVITVPEVRFTGQLPQVGGPDVVVLDVPFDGHYDGSSAGITIEYTTTDTAV